MNWLKAFTLIIVATILTPASTARPLQWHMINVNYKVQGDAHLLIDGFVNSMIDVGQPEPAEKALAPYLKRKGISTIHHLFISHPHTDHYGGIDALLDAGISIKNIYYNLPPEGVEDWNYKRHQFLATIGRAKENGSRVEDVGKGFILKLPSSRIEILHANKDRELNGKALAINDYSIIMRWDARGYRTLFTGDLDEPLGAELAKYKFFKADVLKVPHHGVTSVAPDAFFEVVDPQLNMFASTVALWGHPRIEQVKSWTENAGIAYCNNAYNGTVVLTYSRAGITSQSYKESSRCPDGNLNITPGPKINEHPR